MVEKLFKTVKNFLPSPSRTVKSPGHDVTTPAGVAGSDLLSHIVSLRAYRRP
jgi:hypothetical protein